MGAIVEGRQKYDAVAGAAVDLVRSLGSKVKVGAAVFPGAHVDAMHLCHVGEEVFATTLGDAVRAGRCDPDGPITRAFSSSISLPGNAPPAAPLPPLQRLPRSCPACLLFRVEPQSFLPPTAAPTAMPTASLRRDQIAFPTSSTILRSAARTSIAVLSRCSGPGSANACLDDARTLNAIQAFHAQGIKTYVVGIPGSSPYAALLDQLAVAGGNRASGNHRLLRRRAHLRSSTACSIRSAHRSCSRVTCTSTSRHQITTRSMSISTRRF